MTLQFLNYIVYTFPTQQVFFMVMVVLIYTRGHPYKAYTLIVDKTT